MCLLLLVVAVQLMHKPVVQLICLPPDMQHLTMKERDVEGRACIRIPQACVVDSVLNLLHSVSRRHCVGM